MPTTRHIAWAATFVAVAGSLTALSPGLASAGIHGIEFEQCDTAGRNCVTPTSFVVGQSYWIYAPYDGTSTNTPMANFYDNGTCLGGGSHSVAWVPLTPGTHTISNTGGSWSDSTTVTVVAAPAGSPTPQQPKQGACTGGGGSFGSGSSNLLPGS
ncbi:hypothetical protein [Nocardia sp. CDC160]|uniref:hypothetical protein n=1 Tax=Nocardia sp. CDC160 TaxID=3112166 RepID=UPI002DB8F493|nr:hypothetical protein [Nocardia sp. CDC160]MEC3914453.1 hypothetical protein [Nocardia sp. CDC160]